MADAPNDAAQPAKKSSLISPKVIIVALVCIGIGVGASRYISHKGLASFNKAAKPAVPAKKADAAPVAVLHLETFVVNLADPDHSSFLRLGVALGLSKPLPKGGESEKDSPFIPNIRDAILGVLGTWQSSALLAPDGKTKLKQQLLQILKERAPELGVVDIYFTDFLIQQ